MQALRRLRTVSQSGDILPAVMGILVFGSIWGLVEATLGGALHLMHFAYKGAITGGIGMAIMAAFIVMYRRPRLVFWLGLIAALFKPLSAFIYDQPAFTPFIINPASAILLEALGFTVVASLLFKGFESSVKTQIATGFAAGYLSIILYAVAASALGLGKWASWGFAERATSVLIDGTALAIVGAGLLVLGYPVSTKVRTGFWQFMTVKPKAFYASTIAITALCSVGAIAFA